ncbi:MAG: hypothetical protein Q8936_15030, partial [Bacillota bacterium]|nr:hypothetical protein [Bacillota bacterium]
IVEYSREGLNIFYRNPECIGVKGDINAEMVWKNWLNVGGYKVWPAPQSRWKWPPIFDIDLNTFEYDIKEEEDKIKVTLLSPVSKILNLQFRRTIIMKDGSSAVDIEEEMINHGNEAAKWSLWGITQALSPGKVEIKLNSNTYVGGINFFQEFGLPPQELYKLNKTEEGNILELSCNEVSRYKVGTVTDSAFIKYTCNLYEKPMVYTIDFDYEGEVLYPHGNNVEVYNETYRKYVELEVLGEWKFIEPKESIKLNCTWDLEFL